MKLTTANLNKLKSKIVDPKDYFFKTSLNFGNLQPDISVLDWRRLKIASAGSFDFFGYGNNSIQNLFIAADENAESEEEYVKPISDIDILKDKSKVVKIDPSKYLYTHATIIASVDVEEDDHTITTATNKYINFNGDAWERRLLLNTFKTFIGAYNYYEHVQVPSLKKGWIIDGCSRDVGDTVMIDILVATERKHKDLVASIENGEITAMSMGCCLVDEPIFMSDGGTKVVQDIKEGDFVVSHTGKNQKVSKVFKYNVRGGVPLYIFDFVGSSKKGNWDGKLRLTGEHPILIMEKEEVACKYHKSIFEPCKNHIKRACEIKNCSNYLNKKKVQYKRPGEVRKGDYVLTPIRSSLEVKQKKGLARLLGYYIGDGCANDHAKGGRKSYSKKDYFFSACSFDFGLKEKNFVDDVMQILKSFNCNCSSNKGKSTFRVLTCNKEIVSELIRLGGRHSANKSFNEEVFDWSREDKLNLLNGLINSDGCYYKKGKYVTYSTVSEKLASQIVQLCLQVGLLAFYGSYKNKTGFNYEHRKNSCQIVITGDLDILRTVEGESKVSNDLVIKGSKERFFINASDGNKYLASPVRQITNLQYIGDVYNFEVENDNTYVVSGVTTHNCIVKYTVCSKCGNISETDNDYCEHMKTQKNASYTDNSGKSRKIGELCGHHTDPSSNKFIEASWVHDPAFEIALLRKKVASKGKSPFIYVSSANYGEGILKAASKPRFIVAEDGEDVGGGDTGGDDFGFDDSDSGDVGGGEDLDFGGGGLDSPPPSPSRGGGGSSSGGFDDDLGGFGDEEGEEEESVEDEKPKPDISYIMEEVSKKRRWLDQRLPLSGVSDNENIIESKRISKIIKGYRNK